MLFADPGDETTPVPMTAADAIARETPLPMAIEQDPALVMRRLEVWRDEFFAWVRTLASAAVYEIGRAHV